jgi:NDP-sugar pyrophosphorylase family protein
VIQNSIIAENTVIENQVLKDSLIGSKVVLKANASKLFIGDNSAVDQTQ